LLTGRRRAQHARCRLLPPQRVSTVPTDRTRGRATASASRAATPAADGSAAPPGPPPRPTPPEPAARASRPSRARASSATAGPTVDAMSDTWPTLC